MGELKIGTKVRFAGVDGVVKEVYEQDSDYPIEVIFSSGRRLYFTKDHTLYNEFPKLKLEVAHEVETYKWIYTNAFGDSLVTYKNMTEAEVNRFAIDMVKMPETREVTIVYR